MAKIVIFDTTLRDGAQGEGISFSVEDKLKIVKRLDDFGVDYVEGGWPGAYPKDIEFFRQARSLKLDHAKLVSFGCTRRPKYAAANDPLIKNLAESGTPVVALFGKSWDFHVTDALRVSLDQNLEMIYDSVNYLKTLGREVIFDAEHFFDGYKANPEYAMKSLQAATDAGADVLALCDTNGGSLTTEVGDITSAVRARFKVPVGAHIHNDSGLATANTIIAVERGATHVQGTINGYGERCGNANLCSIIAILILKLGYECLLPGKVSELTEVSKFVDEIANRSPNEQQPFVGRCAFAHKAGVHVDAMTKHPRTYEHVSPDTVGNDRRFLVSEMSGGSTVVQKAKKLGLDLGKSSPEVKETLDEIAHMEHNGYSFEGAEASFELILKKSLGMSRKLFDLKGFRVIIEKRGPNEDPITEATLKISVDGQEAFTVAEGDGPVHALDNALRLALKQFYGKELSKIKLTDFKVRVINTRAGTAAKVRTVIESTDHADSWSTVGVSENIIEASWSALADSVEYGLLRNHPE